MEYRRYPEDRARNDGYTGVRIYSKENKHVWSGGALVEETLMLCARIIATACSLDGRTSNHSAMTGTCAGFMKQKFGESARKMNELASFRHNMIEASF